MQIATPWKGRSDRVGEQDRPARANIIPDEDRPLPEAGLYRSTSSLFQEVAEPTLKIGGTGCFIASMIVLLADVSTLPAAKEEPNMTSFSSRLSTILAFGLVVGVSISTSIETVKVMDQASTDGSFIVAQTNGQDRRANRQDCRQQGGLVGKDKRDCKQEGRSK